MKTAQIVNSRSINLKLQLWNLNFIHGSGWYIIIKPWKIYNGKIEVVSFMSFVTGSCRKLTISFKFEVHIKKWGRGSCFSCFCCLLQVLCSILMEFSQQSLLMDKTSSKYLIA